MLSLAKGNFLCELDKVSANEVKEVKQLFPPFYTLALRPPLMTEHQAGAYVAPNKDVCKATIFAVILNII